MSDDAWWGSQWWDDCRGRLGAYLFLLGVAFFVLLPIAVLANGLGALLRVGGPLSAFAPFWLWSAWFLGACLVITLGLALLTPELRGADLEPQH